MHCRFVKTPPSNQCPYCFHQRYISTKENQWKPVIFRRWEGGTTDRRKTTTYEKTFVFILSCIEFQCRWFIFPEGPFWWPTMMAAVKYGHIRWCWDEWKTKWPRSIKKSLIVVKIRNLYYFNFWLCQFNMLLTLYPY